MLSSDLYDQMAIDIECKARIPDVFVDKIDQDILVDPVIAGDGLTYSRKNIIRWFSYCESQNMLPCSPYTSEVIDSTLKDANTMQRRIASIEKRGVHLYRRESMVDTLPTSASKKKSTSTNTEEVLSLHQLTRLHQCISHIPDILSDDISLYSGNVLKLAVIGNIGCGKSSLLESLTLYSLFPSGACTTHTQVPVIIKMRHTTEVNVTMPVLRVIDTKKKVSRSDDVYFVFCMGLFMVAVILLVQ